MANDLRSRCDRRDLGSTRVPCDPQRNEEEPMKKNLMYVAAPFHFAFKTVLTTVITLMFVSSLLVNATMLTWQTGALAIGGMFASATGISAVANSLKHGNDTLKKKNGKLVAEADGLKARNLTKNKAVEKITSRIADRTTRSATLNVAAIPVEAIPVVGIGAVLAVTTWELTEACGIMRDMKELNIALGSAEPVADDAVCGMEPPTKKQVWDTIKNSPGAAWKAVKEFGVNLPDLPGITRKKD